MKRTILLTAVVAVVAAAGAGVYLTREREGGEISGFVCSNLDNAQMYDQHGLDYIKMVVPGREGWVFRTEDDFRTGFKISAKTTALLQSLQDAMRENGSELVIAMAPLRGLVHADKVYPRYQEKYQSVSSEALWKSYADMVAGLREAGLKVAAVGPEQAGDAFFYKRNHHWTAQGARVMAENIAQEAKKIPLYATLPKQEYMTVSKGFSDYESSFDKAFEKLCGEELPPEQAETFQTRPVNTAGSESDLFGDSGQPGVVLLGTSNSVDESSNANFAGFLQQSLSTDVYNMSFIGSGIDTGLIAYLNSDLYRNGQQKIVIWEIPAYYNLDMMDDKLFNQAIPAAYGSCEGSEVLAKNFGPLEKGMNSLLNVEEERRAQLLNPSFTPAQAGAGMLGPQPQPQAGAFLNPDALYYIHLSFAEPVEDKFQLRFHYANEDVKLQAFSRAERYPADGEYYSLFPLDERDTKLLQITLEIPEEMAGNRLEFEVCPLPEQNSFTEYFNKYVRG